MELTIRLSKKNKDRIIALINDLAELEDDDLSQNVRIEPPLQNTMAIPPDSRLIGPVGDDLLDVPGHVSGLKPGKLGFAQNSERPGLVGSWGQFNSFFPMKAACIIVSNIILAKRNEDLRLDRFVDLSLQSFKKRNLSQYRGFPSTEKDTARGRFVWHFLSTAYEMGLLTLSANEGSDLMMPESLNDWERYHIGVSAEGLEFARIHNPLIMGNGNEQILTSDETKWMISHLKKIDSQGYREYSLLLGVYQFLREGHNGKDDLRKWFEENEDFRKYVKTWSRKARNGTEKESSDQLSNLAMTFAGSKVALLRELRIVDPRRNHYEIIGEFN